MAKVKPVRPGSAKAGQKSTGAKKESRQTRRLAANLNESRQTRRLAANLNESRQTRRLAANLNESLARR